MKHQESLEEAPVEREEGPLDLTLIKAALAEWRRLKARAPGGEWIEDSPCVYTAEDGIIAAGEDFPTRDAVTKFIAHAHNTPIEDYLQQLIDEVERLRGDHA